MIVFSMVQSQLRLIHKVVLSTIIREEYGQ